jgi:GNAT superfamily N-acetyltransferase
MVTDIPIVIRRETFDDVSLIVHHRRAMFEDMKRGSAKSLDAMDAAFEPWLRKHMAAGDYLGWFAEVDGVAVAGVGLWMMEWPPGPLDPSDRRPYILNVYTEPDYRGHGLATQLMRILMDYCQTQGFKAVVLHASHFGRPVYDHLGFVSTNEMRLQF